ncbi:hypothetical protein SRHO_G00077030 [Serrasalmus rhombeus]
MLTLTFVRRPAQPECSDSSLAWFWSTVCLQVIFHYKERRQWSVHFLKLSRIQQALRGTRTPSENPPGDHVTAELPSHLESNSGLHCPEFSGESRDLLLRSYQRSRSPEY